MDPLYAVVMSVLSLFTLIYLRLHIALALLSSSLLLAILTLSPSDIVLAYITTATRKMNIDVIVTSIIIAVMAYLYRESGVITKLTNSIVSLFRNVWLSLTVIPAVFGLLPVPGGALMSAPLVSEISRNLNLSKDKAAYINIWYRHIIPPAYPLTQLVILASALSGFNSASIALYNVPIVLAMYLIGFVPIHSELKKSLKLCNTSINGIHYIIPLVVAVSVVILGLDVVTASALGLLTLITIVRPNYKSLLRSILNKEVLLIGLTTYAALSFREVLALSKFPEAFISYFATSSQLIVTSIMVISAFLGFVLGIPTGAIAITIPLIVSVSASIKYVCLTTLFAYVGYMISPSHLCLVLTLRYFNVSLSGIYRYLLVSTFVAMALILIIYNPLL